VADLAGSRVLVFDVRQNRLAGTIPGVQSVHGVLAVPELGRVYASATGVDQLVAIDETSLKIAARIPAGHYPDGIAWEPKLRKLYVSDETGRTVAVVDAASNRIVRTIPAGGEVGNTQYDAGSGLIYSNEQTNNRLIGIDPKTDRIVSRDSLPGCEGAHGLLIEATRRLAFVACEGNAKLLTFSLARHAKVGEASIGHGPDVLAYDLSKGWLYVSSESGVVSIFQVGSDGARKIGQSFLADNAHVVAVDPASHRVFFPLRNLGGRSMLRVMEPR
jgi:DNA-binding beta-propeller fold protein YncE